jgi:murein L,D-transpeptidase YcbB/YkuD
MSTTAGRSLTDALGNPAEPLVGAASPSPTPVAVQRWISKATAYANGWASSFEVPPTLWNTVLGLSVAQHETFCGDAWVGEHNWGAVQLGGLNAAEAECLKTAGLTPTSANLAKARLTLAAANLSRSGGALHIDTSPIGGAYFAWFHAFATDAAGASYFVKVLAGSSRPSCRAVLEASLGGWQADAQKLAQTMYDTRYYEGFHDPRKPGGIAANVADYAAAILAQAPNIALVLLTGKWVPPSGPQFDLTSTAGVQSALTFLAGKMHQQAFDPLGVDNVFGKNTSSAVKAFQVWAKLPVSGAVDQHTADAIRAQLTVVLGTSNPPS